jgi:hypothetical protein
VFWEEAQVYNKLTNDSDKETKLRELYDKFLATEAPAELNLPNKIVTVDPVVKAADEYRDKCAPIPDNVLEVLINHCRGDMMDFFQRFQVTDKWRKIEIALKKEETELVLMSQSGMEAIEEGTLIKESNI